MGVRTTPDANTILIIDDSPEDRDIYRQFLLRDSLYTYQFVETETGQEGLKAAQENTLSLILVDFQLPDMNGLDVISALRQARMSSVPVIMLTGRGDEATAVRAMKQGAYDYLVKQQVTPERLQSAVHKALVQADLKSQLEHSHQRQNIISSIALRIRQTLALNEILERATIEAHKLLDCDRVLLYQFSADMSGQVVAESVSSGYASTLGQNIQDTCFQNAAGQHYAQGKLGIIHNTHQAKLSVCHLRFLQKLEVRASLIAPLLLKPQTQQEAPHKTSDLLLWGLLIAHQCDRPRPWKTSECQLIEALSVQLAIAIQQAELLDKTQIALQREQELNALKSKITATISHEYRAPLASILTAISTLTTHQNKLSISRQEKCLQIISKKAWHLNSLVDDILLMNKIELGQVHLNPVPIDLAHFITDEIDTYKLETPDHQISLEIIGEMTDFRGDPKVLRQILFNVLSNAIKYSPTGGKIDVRLHEQSSQIILIIQDQGIGISEADKVHLFQPFYRGQNVDTIQGTGLGLSIVKACVEMSGGKISYSSQPEQGTRVTIGLPKNITANISAEH